MMKYLFITLLALVSLTANAADVVLEQLPDDYGELTYHLRVKANKSQMRWGIVWNYISPDNYRGIELSADLLSANDDFTMQPYRVEQYRVTDGVRQTESVSTAYDKGDARRGISLKLRKNSIGAVVEFGTTTPSEIFSITYDGASNGQVGSYCETPMTVVRHTVDAEKLDGAQYAPFETLQQLADYLAATTDAMEGYWEYLDRETDSKIFNVGGDYRFATVKVGDRYAVVYLSGARTNEADWQPLRIKAWLQPTIFIGNYDLVWYDPFGVKLDYETSAQVTDNAIISFNFPIYNSKVRWRRMLNAMNVISGDVVSQR